MIDLINSVCQTISLKYTNYPIYINPVDKFSRPSFYVYLVADSKTDANLKIKNRTTSISIVYFGPKDSNNNIDAENKYLIYEELSNLFESSIAVKDRYYKIVSMDGGPRDNEVYLTLRIQYAVDATRPVETYDTMNDLYYNYNKNI